MPPDYAALVQARRALSIEGYASFADAGLDGPWTTPYHIAAASPDGPVLLTYNYLDAASARQHRQELLTHGYLARMPFNSVLDLALAMTGMSRADLYVTHAFHLLPPTRSAAVAASLIDQSFDTVGRHEVQDRRVIALGAAATRVCRRHGVVHMALPHLSARGLTYQAKAKSLATALRR